MSAELAAVHGGYPALFERLFARAGLGPERLVHINAREGELPGPATADAYLVTGSQHSVYDPLPWIARLAEFCRSAMAAGRPVIGICFGHQLLAHFFGGRVAPASAGWQIGVQRYQVTQRRAWLAPAASQFELLASHQDQVVALPPGARVLAASARCPVAAFELGPLAVGVQGHPEFTRAYARDLFETRRAQIGDAVCDAAASGLAAPLSADLVTGWLCNFIGHAGSKDRGTDHD
jgi:GMP synthase (glutamine-hydrolysing)